MDQGLTSARGRLAVLAGICLLTLTLTLSSAARAASRPAAEAEPDLVVAGGNEGLGHNPYLVVPQSGEVPNITVKVTTRNVGHAPAPESNTAVVLVARTTTSSRSPPSSTSTSSPQATGRRTR